MAISYLRNIFGEKPKAPPVVQEPAVPFDVLPEYITDDFLYECGACEEGRNQIRNLFGGGPLFVRRTRANLRTVIKSGQTIAWLIEHPRLRAVQREYTATRFRSVLSQMRWLLDRLAIPDDSPTELENVDVPMGWRE